MLPILHSLLLQAGAPHGTLFPEAFHPEPLVASGKSWWVAALLFTSFTVLVLLRIFDYRKLALLFNGFVRASSVSALYREEYSLTSRVSLMLLLNYLVIFPLFIWQCAPFFGTDHDGPGGFGKIAAGIALAYFIKIACTRLLGSVFEVRDASSEYVYNILLFNKTVGLVLFPVCLLLAYARQIPPEILIWTGIVFWSLILVYRLLRVFLIDLSSSGISFLYIILYLCTLEIIPFVVILKVFVGTFQPFNP